MKKETERERWARKMASISAEEKRKFRAMAVGAVEMAGVTVTEEDYAALDRIEAGLSTPDEECLLFLENAGKGDCEAARNIRKRIAANGG